MPEENRSLDAGSHGAADAKKEKVSRQEDGSRRGFFSEILAFFIGGAILTVPLVGGLALFLDPLLASQTGLVERTGRASRCRRFPARRVAGIASRQRQAADLYRL